jgi:hypothetical protein
MSNRSMGAAQASALRISQLESEVERLKGLEATVAALSKRLDKFEREAAEVSALENYPDATPTAENATDYDQHRDKCCTNIDHWKLMVRGSQRYKMENYVNVIHEKFKYETDFQDNFVLDRNGDKIPRGENACWLKQSLLRKRGYKLQFNTKITCPLTETRNLPMGMSAYKLVAIMNYPSDAPEVDLAFGEPFPRSAISIELLLTLSQK